MIGVTSPPAKPSRPTEPTLSDAVVAREVYAAVEHGRVAVPIERLLVHGALDIYPDVSRRGDLFSIQLRKGALEFSAGKFVGLIPINDRVAIDVRPRSPANLARMLEVSGYAPHELIRFVRRYQLSDEWSDSLLDLYARALVSVVDVIEAEGVLREYHRVQEDTSFPRGRILLWDTVVRHWARGERHKARVALHRQTEDNGANRLLKYTIWYLAQIYSRSRPTKGWRWIVFDLNRLYHLFEAVSLDVGLGFLDDPVVRQPELLPASRSYYRPCIEIARAILHSQGLQIDVSGDDVPIPSLLVSLDRTFEMYVRQVLRREFSELSPSVAVLDGNFGGEEGGRQPLFDTAPSEDATPDVVIELREPGRLRRLVVEVKYIDRVFASDEIYQAISYAASYRAPCVLVRPSTDGMVRGWQPLGTLGSIRIDSYVLPAGSPKPQDDERVFAAKMLDAVKAS